ncbi:adenylyltransferase/cytidyltransferase family protein [Patescibacteria group bacterium]|nr:adenylyltransferase/cytidyltransferase family protein [Patescibacteria group bacterium]
MDKVMVFGTFDILHPGHLDFFRQARKYGDYLVVVIARDKTVSKLKRTPLNSEEKRLHEVEKILFVDHARLGYLDDPYKIILEERPNTICLGYDQEFFIDKLESFLEKCGLCVIIKKLKPYKKNQYKSRFLKCDRNNTLFVDKDNL